MKKLIFTLIFLLALAGPVWAVSLQTILYPNLNGDTATWAVKDSTATGRHWTSVDDLDASPDTGTYVYLNNLTNKVELQKLTDFTDTLNLIAIDSVRLHERVKRGSSAAYDTFYWYDGTTRLKGGVITLTTSWADQYEKRATNLTGGAWTTTNLNNLQVGSRGTAASSRYIYNTLVHTHIYYRRNYVITQTKQVTEINNTGFSARDSAYTDYSGSADRIYLRVGASNAIASSSIKDSSVNLNIDTLQATGLSVTTKYYYWLIATDSMAGLARKTDTTTIDSITTLPNYMGSIFPVTSTNRIFLTSNSYFADYRFTAKDSSTIDSVYIFCDSVKPTPGTALIRLESDDGTGICPSGNSLSKRDSVSFTAHIWNGIDIPNYKPTAGTIYHLVIKRGTSGGSWTSTAYYGFRYSLPLNHLYPVDMSSDASSNTLYGDTTMWGDCSASDGEPIFILIGTNKYGNPYDSLVDQAVYGATGAPVWAKQRWTPSSNMRISTLGVYSKRSTTSRPADSLYYEIRDTNGTTNGVPGQLLRSGVAVTCCTGSDSSTISYAYHDKNLSSAWNVYKDSVYHFIWKSPGSTSANFYRINRPRTTGNYKSLTWGGTNSCACYPADTTTFVDSTQQDYVIRIGYTPNYIISGTVRDADGTPIPGCSLSVTGTYPQTLIANSSGIYLFYVNYISSDTITPHLNDWLNWTPAKRIIINPVGDSTTLDFIQSTTSAWADTSYHKRMKINFGDTHDTIPSGYTASLPFSSGTMNRVATNATGLVGLNIAVQSTGNMWYAYTILDPAGDNFQYWVVKFNFSTSSWGTPYIAGMVPTGGGDWAHFEPSILADNYDTLHLFYGCHVSAQYYKRSNSTDPTDSSTGSTGWTTVVQIDTGSTYPWGFVDAQNRIYLEHRRGSAESGYSRSTDGGHTWGNFTQIVNTDACCPGGGTGSAVYGHFIVYGDTINCGWTYVCPYNLSGNHWIGYVRGIIDAGTGNVSWQRVNGTSISVPVGCDSTDTIIYPRQGTMATNALSAGAYYDVDNLGYPRFLPHISTPYLSSTRSLWYFRWDGTKWTVPTNVSTAITPNRYIIPLARGYPFLNRIDNTIYQFSMIKMPQDSGTVIIGSGTNSAVIDWATGTDTTYYVNEYFRQETGTGVGQERKITQCHWNSSSGHPQIWVTPDFTTTPETGDHYVISPKWFAGELGLFKWDGNQWTFQLLTEKSGYGLGFQGVAMGNKLLLNQATMMFWREPDIVYRAFEGSNYKWNGDDIRVYYQGKEIDRVAQNYWNNTSTIIDFKTRNQILPNKNFDQMGNYYVYFDKSSAINPKNDPDSVYPLYEGWEMFAGNGEKVGGKRGWIADSSYVESSDNTHILSIFDGDKSLIGKRTYLKRSMGSDSTNYEISVWQNSPKDTLRSYVGLKDNTTEFRIGSPSCDMADTCVAHKYFYYNNSTWLYGTNSNNPLWIPSVWKDYKIIVSPNGCTGLIGGDTVIVNNTTITKFDTLTIGAGLIGGRYIDHIIIKKWLAIPPIMSVGDGETWMNTISGSLNILKRLQEDSE